MQRQGTVHRQALAADRLAQLGLHPAMLEHALRGADAEARTYTELDPPHMAGMARYSRTVRLLREQLVPLGWSFDNPRNLARTVSPDRRVALVAASGDAATGCPDVVPSTRYERGLATMEAVNRNFVQQPLPIFLDEEYGHLAESEEPDPAELDQSVGPATWLLLYFVGDTEIRAELSLPDSMIDGYVDTWIERILLPPVAVETSPVVEVTPTAPTLPLTFPSVPVTRRAR